MVKKSADAKNIPGNMTNPAEIFTTYYRSPIGMLSIEATATAVQEVAFYEESEVQRSPAIHSNHCTIMQLCVEQLDSYFSGKRKQFELPLEQPGTAFQQRVWNELLKIPYGGTISYLELSRRLGNEKAIRAAAATNGKNRIAVIVPCHRVIGSNQQLVGYAGGLPRKKWLLEHELRYAFGKQSLF